MLRRGTGPADPDLPVLDGADADWLRARLVAELGRAGLPGARADGGHVTAADGTRFGLAALATALVAAPRLSWGARVRRHAASLARLAATALPATPDALPGGPDGREGLVARVVGDDGGTPDADRYGPALAPGLRAVVCLDTGTEVLGPLDLAPLGGWAAVGPRALAALRALPLPVVRTLRTEDGDAVHVLVSEDVFGAGRLLLLDEVLAATLRWERPAHGLLVAVPNRHVVVVHALEEAAAVPAAMRLMLAFSAAAAATAAPVSPAVYHRTPDGALERLTHGPLVDGLPEGSRLPAVLAALPHRRPRDAAPGGREAA